MYRNFEGTINDRNLKDLKITFFREYYNAEHSAQERVQDVNNFLNKETNGFLEEYISNQYWSKPTSNQPIADGDSVCKFMDYITDYLIKGCDEHYDYDRSNFSSY